MKLSNIINDLRCLANYLESYESLIDLPNCNDCGILKTCKYAPKLGERVRINCPLWQTENKEEKK